jgi:cytidylate kinase
MYRAVALCAFERGLQAEDAPQIASLARSLDLRLEEGGTRVFVGPREVSGEIRAPHIASLTSQIAAIPNVRSVIVEMQRTLGRHGEETCGGAVLEGRDIQTVVFPDASVKIFLSAEPRTRAMRRVDEWASRGESADVDETERALRERDERDSGREDSPLKAAPDATILSTDGKTPEEVVEEIARLAQVLEGNSR